MNDRVRVDEALTLEYTSHDNLGGTFTWYKDEIAIQTFQTCIPREPDLVDFKGLAPYAIYTLKPSTDMKCAVDIFSVKPFTANEIQLNDHEGFSTEKEFVGLVFKSGGFNPFEIHILDMTTMQRSVEFAVKDHETEMLDEKLLIKNTDRSSKSIVLSKA